MKILSIGAGKQESREGLVRLDIAEETKPDILWDLNNGPYPIPDEEFDVIECFDVIEHVNDIPFVFNECFRILKPNGTFILTTPHFSNKNSYVDPTHKYHLSYFSFDCFSSEHEYSYYSKSRFKIQKREILFEGPRIRKVLFYHFANKFPNFYETYLAWIFPGWFLYFELKK